MNNLEHIAENTCLSAEELSAIESAILETGFMTQKKAREQLERFVLKLGINDYYFKNTPVGEISRHLIAISASEMASQYGSRGMGVELITEETDRALYIVEESMMQEIEDRMEGKYPGFRIESYSTEDFLGRGPLRLYVASRPTFDGSPRDGSPLSFENDVSADFKKDREAETIKRYKEAWDWMSHREAPFISITEKLDTDETRVMIGIHGQGSRRFMARFTSLTRSYDIISTRKYKETFLDDKSIYTFYFARSEQTITEDFSRELSAIVLLPEHPITELFASGAFSSQTAVYAISAAAFTYHFVTALTDEYLTLSLALKDQPESKGILEKIKLRSLKDTYSETVITKIISDFPDIINMLYEDFVYRLHPKNKAEKRIVENHVDNIQNTIQTRVASAVSRSVLEFFLVFNRSIMKTNVFRRDKICAVYRLDPVFLDPIDYPEKPFGVFFCIGRSFIGFHIRFRDISRGGIRIVKSRNHAEFRKNIETIFMENYNLALAQQKKNKDIPEAGSKGVILLLGPENQNEGGRAFRDYIDGILDVILPHDDVTDYYRKEEALFFGPDEGTAELMDWVPHYGKKQGYPFWRALSTGKSQENGGIPHDLYGMTTTGVHEYVMGILERLGMEEAATTKIQTGGPDGDLGSNEIKISKDKTIAVVDGSGVVYDPCGLQRKELFRLAANRKMVEHFDLSTLSPDGFFISINDTSVTLPCGTFIPNGEDFRNTFHLSHLAKADLFVPCGGRPASVNINNWRELFDESGRPRFKIIVEGANLFITEEARLRLEENGVILIKDAAANKGGVTSSSLEVFAALSLDDWTFEKHFMSRNGKIPDFMENYAGQVVETIRKNARREFDLLWREKEQKQYPFTLLINDVSRKINDITDAVADSDLPDDPVLKRKAIREYTPDSLLDLVGLDTILSRVPEMYLRAVVATKLAADFVYTYGIDGNAVDFYRYISSMKGT